MKPQNSERCNSRRATTRPDQNMNYGRRRYDDVRKTTMENVVRRRTMAWRRRATTTGDAGGTTTDGRRQTTTKGRRPTCGDGPTTRRRTTTDERYNVFELFDDSYYDSIILLWPFSIHVSKMYVKDSWIRNTTAVTLECISTVWSTRSTWGGRRASTQTTITVAAKPDTVGYQHKTYKTIKIIQNSIFSITLRRRGRRNEIFRFRNKIFHFSSGLPPGNEIVSAALTSETISFLGPGPGEKWNISFLKWNISFLVAACSFAFESLCVRIVLFCCHAFQGVEKNHTICLFAQTMPIWSPLGLSGAPSNYLEPSGAIWSSLELSRAI